jgi:excisionase family DNA binding protein
MTKNTVESELLTPAEVATLFRVDAKTVTRWAKAGKIASIRTLGGHRRYNKADVMALLGKASRQPATAHSTIGICTLAPRRPHADVGLCRACLEQGLFDALPGGAK